MMADIEDEEEVKHQTETEEGAPAAEEGDVQEDATPTADDTKPSGEEDAKPEEDEDEGGIMEPSENDVIAGRGAAVNLNKGNQKFRALCFKRKPEFDVASHAAKRRIATEIVAQTKATGRFLKRKREKGPWFEIGDDKAVLKACQVMRDYQRPDRIALRGAGGRKRQRTNETTPMDTTPVVAVTPVQPILENPYGVHDHDVLSGRGAFVNGHVGNNRFRKLCLERKPQFDAGGYTEKKALATEVYEIISALDPPGRFLKRLAEGEPPLRPDATVIDLGPYGNWEQLMDDKAIHKATQVMRDIARPDRVGGRRKSKGDEGWRYKEDKETQEKQESDPSVAAQAKDSMTMLAETTAEASAVEEAVMATEEALDKALDSVPKAKEVTEVEI